MVARWSSRASAAFQLRIALAAIASGNVPKTVVAARASAAQEITVGNSFCRFGADRFLYRAAFDNLFASQ
jgi:hypothetical protein